MLVAWLYNWQTLIGAVLASLIAVASAAVAWMAAMKQISSVQSERQRRETYAATLASHYLLGVKQLHAKVEKEHKTFGALTLIRLQAEPQLAPTVLRRALKAFIEPNPRPLFDDVDQYREELPLFLFTDLKLVARLESDLNAFLSTAAEQQSVYNTFPLDECQNGFREAVVRLNQAIVRAEHSFDRYRHE